MDIMTFAIINTTVVVLGFCFCVFTVFSYFKHQDILRKSENVTEYTRRELAHKNPVIEQEEEAEEEHYKDITDVSANEVFKLR